MNQGWDTKVFHGSTLVTAFAVTHWRFNGRTRLTISGQRLRSGIQPGSECRAIAPCRLLSGHHPPGRVFITALYSVNIAHFSRVVKGFLQISGRNIHKPCRERASTVPQRDLTCGTMSGEFVHPTISPECTWKWIRCTADRSMPGPYIGLYQRRSHKKPPRFPVAVYIIQSLSTGMVVSPIRSSRTRAGSTGTSHQRVSPSPRVAAMELPSSRMTFTQKSPSPIFSQEKPVL